MRTPGRKQAAPQRDGVITSLSVRRGRPDRTLVGLEDAAELELASILVERVGLRVGALLTEEMQERLLREDEPYRARSRALHLLALRDRSRRELETRLRDLGFSHQVVADTATWLGALGYLDDRRFAERYAAEKLRAGWGSRRISSELLRKGIERAQIEQALDVERDNAQAALEGSEALRTLVHRRFARQFATDADAAERRLMGYLARRGYDWETSARVARELRSEVDSQGGPP